jgi:hypothetical protein
VVAFDQEYAMSQRHIPWFNPRELDDATVIALSTGRDLLLANFFRTINERLESHAPGRHWLVTGTRGAGKSYFLRLIQSLASTRLPAGRARFVLLPEELNNVDSPQGFLDEVHRLLKGTATDYGSPSAWRLEEPTSGWNASLSKLLSSFDEALLIIGVENFKEVLDCAFGDDVSAALLRSLMAHEPRIMLLVTAVDGSFDENYQQRLFRQFEHHPLPAWGEQAHRDYMMARGKVVGKTPSEQQLARIDAYSRFTGGNARIASVLAAALLVDRDLLDADNDFNATLDVMSDYYREQLGRLPPNTRKLFDALLRQGEPCSQTALAARVGTTQNDIARAFGKMIEGGYLFAERDRGEKETRYRVADRLFVAWYRMRYLEPGKRSRLSVMAELIADTVSFNEKWRYVQTLSDKGRADDALLLAKLGLNDAGIPIQELEKLGFGLQELLRVGKWLALDAPTGHASTQLWLNFELLEQYPSDEALTLAIQDAKSLVGSRYKRPGVEKGKALAALVAGSLSLSPSEKLRILQALAKPNCSPKQWDNLTEVFQDEVKDFERLLRQGANIEALRENLNLAQTYPVASSWEILALRLSPLYPLYEEGTQLNSALDKLVFEASANAIASILWNKADNFERAGRSTVQLARSLANLLYGYNQTAIVLNLTETLNNEFTKANNQVTESLAIAVQTIVSDCQIRLGYQDRAVASFDEAVTRFNNDTQPVKVAYPLSRKAWALGMQKKQQAAHLVFLQAAQLQIEGGKPQEASWSLGQAIRHLTLGSTFESAFKLMEEIIKKYELNEETQLVAWQQVFDGVGDQEVSNDRASAYSFGRKLIEQIAKNTSLPIGRLLRLAVIDMVDRGVTFALQRDLLNEVPAIIGAEKADEIHETIRLLGSWLDDLEAPDRIQRRKKLDPDLAITLEALDKELGVASRVRLGLAEQPKPSENALAMHQRILALMKQS